MWTDKTHSVLRSRGIAPTKETGQLHLGLGALGGCARESQSIGHPHQVGERAGFHFAHEVAAMDLHGNFADAEIGGDLLVAAAGNDPRPPLLFAPGYAP